MNWSPSDIAEAQALYDEGYNPTRVAEKFRRFGRAPGLKGSDVAKMINTHRSVVPGSVALRAQIRRIRETEWVSYPIIAERLGTSVNIVERACFGLRPPKGVKVKTTRGEAAFQGQRNDLENDRLIRFKTWEPVEVPAWVPDHLFELYEHTARTQDEHVAARIVRDLKRGNSVAFAAASAQRATHGAA
ncbi:hypothetical protein CIW48_26995 [Methylobacterium sp. P1-11]|uniref:hypothetical protein n=1 Tax=Methylobacterium sp. P1-11 TaxID=2024616 RepID=UPI0011EBE2E0|nr:hypothetical protein [Methylobacterium sp. P1-11]KAA0117854.1 hypothetical protein CIW48_26995 [Methylobacterium sp. P1-11]